MKSRTIWIYSCVSFPLIDVVAFGVNLGFRRPTIPSARVKATSCQSRIDDDLNGTDDSMDDSFRRFEQLIASENDRFPSSQTLQELNLTIQAEDGTETTLMSEMALFKGMLSELSETTETEVIANLKNELVGFTTASRNSSDVGRSETEIFLEVALDQALKEAEIKAQIGIDKESLLENKEIMEEIEKIFEKANLELMEGIEEIRREQMALAVASAARNAKLSKDRIDVNQERLAVAEENMRRMLVKVNQETKNVESAIEDLKRAQVDLQGGIDDELMNLKRAGFAKQATLVGGSLFALRSIVEGFAFIGGDATHFTPAMLQGTIALACFVAFVVI